MCKSRVKLGAWIDFGEVHGKRQFLRNTTSQNAILARSTHACNTAFQHTCSGVFCPSVVSDFRVFIVEPKEEARLRAAKLSPFSTCSANKSLSLVTFCSSFGNG